MKTETHKNKFLKIPIELAQRTDLNWTEKALAAQLMWHGRKSSPIFPSQDLLCAELGIKSSPPKKKQDKQPANRTIRRAIKGLGGSGDFRTRREGNRRNNRYFPCQSLAKIFDYEGETAESVSGQNDQSEAGAVTGQKRSSDWSKVDTATGQKQLGSVVKNGRLTGQNDPLINSINISIEPEESNTNINIGPDQDFDWVPEDFDFEFNYANANGASNKRITGEWPK